MSQDSEPQILLRMVEALRQASGCAHQLAHAQQNPGFLATRDVLEALRETCMKMATSKPVPRQRVLAMLDERQAAIKVN